MSSPSGSNERGITVDQLRAQVEQQLSEQLNTQQGSVQSREYSQFKRDNTPMHHSLYERWALAAGKIFAIDAGKNTQKIAQDLETAHIAISPKDVMGLALLAPICVFFVSLILTVLLPFIVTGNLSIFYFVFSIIIAGMVYVPLRTMPSFLAQNWRQRASNQMVLCIFYMVTYMRHTPNLELAIQFAADHIGPPLSLDLKKVLWDVETQHFQNVTESLEFYLIRWRENAREFIESIHLIQSSLYEASNERRLSSLDKSLDVMLEETYEKMLHYAQDLKSPMTMLHMLGIILPVLGLVILPLAVSFMETHWTVIATLYNILLPCGVYYLGRRILSSRPTGYGEATFPERSEYDESTKNAKAFAIVIAFFLFIIGISPLLLHGINPDFDVSIGAFTFLGYIVHNGVEQGPFGLGAGLISILITLGAGISLGYFYSAKTKLKIKIRRRTRKLEEEFASALFTLGNRIGDGIPAEIAFGKVAEIMEGTTAGKFYAIVATNIQKLGMGVEEALFHPDHGAVSQFPSPLIESSMKVLLESSRKGPHEASQALMSMSSYIKEMHRVDERLKDLLADVLSSMRSQINFLLPVIAGIVIGITSMITTVLGQVNAQAAQFEAGGVAQSLPLDLFGLGIPTFYFQIVVGLYVVQVVWILAYLISGIENGVDPLSEQWLKGRALTMSTTLYCVIAFIVMMVFNLLAGQIITVVA